VEKKFFVFYFASIIKNLAKQNLVATRFVYEVTESIDAILALTFIEN